MVAISFKKDDVKTFSTRRLIGTISLGIALLLSVAFFVECLIENHPEWAFKIILLWAFIGVGLILGAKVMDKIFSKVVDKL